MNAKPNLPIPDFSRPVDASHAPSQSPDVPAITCDRSFFEAREKEFKTICRRLNLDEDTSSRAWELLISVPPQTTTNPERLFKCLTACSVYSAGKLGSTTTIEGGRHLGSGVPLAQLLKLAGVRLFAFIKLMKAFCTHVDLSTQVELLERKFVVVSVLYQKYEDLFEKILARKGSKDTRVVFYTGWILFLVAKGQLLSDPPELVKAYHLLLCCLFALHERFPSATSRIPASATQTPFEVLATFGLANFADASALYREKFEPFVKSIIENDESMPSAAPSEDGEDGVLLWTKSKLESQYALLCHASSDFDERLFLTAPSDIGTPSRRREPQTPMRTALEAADWLTTVTDSLSSVEMGVDLRRHCDECDKSLAGNIASRASALSLKLPFSESRTKRQETCRKLYYLVLERLVVAEEQRTGKTHFASLLNNDAFHKSLFACCVVITAVALRANDMQYPVPLGLIGVSEFSFLKVIENLVRHCTMGGLSLHPSILKHLKRIEINILECRGWRESSTVVELLRNAAFKQSLVSYIQQWSARGSAITGNRAALLASPGITRLKRAPSALYSPAPKSTLRPNTSAAPSPTPRRPSARSHSLQLFYRKLLQLAEQRLSDLCANMKLPSSFFGLVWGALIDVLVDHWDVLVDRHLDQIIMCTLFGVAKANGITHISFNDIAKQYMRLPHAQDQTVRGVRGANKDELMDIISFYNQVFVASLDGVLRAHRAPSGDMADAAVSIMGHLTPRKFLANTPLPPVRLSVSPASRKRASPSSSMLSSHSVGQSPSNNLREINDAIRGSPTKPGPQKKLRFDHVSAAAHGGDAPSVPGSASAATDEDNPPAPKDSSEDANSGTT